VVITDHQRQVARLVQRAFEGAFGSGSGRIFEGGAGITVSYSSPGDHPLVLVFVNDRGTVSLSLDNYECEDVGDPLLLGEQLKVVGSAIGYARLSGDSAPRLAGFTLTDGLATLTFTYVGEEGITDSVIDAWLARLGVQSL